MALNFDHQRNRISSSSNNITINTNGGLTLPVGSTGDRPTPAQGMIRYNTTDSRFEAYNGTVWTGLGGVIDTDQNTYIIAESSPGANNNELDFYTNAVKRMQINSSGNLLFGNSLNKFTVNYATGATVIAGKTEVTVNNSSSSTTSGSLVVTGGVGVSENLYVGGNINVTGDVAINGNLTFGDSDADGITINADINSSLVPNASGTNDIGQSGKTWRNIYISKTLTYEGATTENRIVVPTNLANALNVRDSSNNNIVIFDTTTNNIRTTFKGIVDIDSIRALKLPVGTTSDRPTAEQGMIRYNTSYNLFEAYNGSSWSGLGGVTDLDKNTYIVAETTPGANNNDLDFYTAGTQRLQIDETGAFNFGGASLDKFTIAYATGNTAIKGTFSVDGAATLASAKVSNLTDHRIVIAGVAGALEGDANFRFNSSTFDIGAAGFEKFSVVVSSGNTDINGTLDVAGQTTLATVNILDITSGRVPYATTAGQLTSSSNLTFDGSTLNATAAVNITGDLDVDNININGNTIISTNTNGNINLTPNGSGEVVASSLTVSDLTSTRLVFAGTSGALTDSANLTYSGSALDLSTSVNITGDLDVDNININANTIISTNTDGDINLTPNGTGKVIASSLKVSDLTTNRIVIASSNGLLVDNANLTFDGTTLTATAAVNITGDLDVDNININGNTIISTNTDGNINLTPNGTGEVVASSLTVSDLTNNRIVIAGTSGALTNNSNLTYDGTTFAIGSDKFTVVSSNGNTETKGSLTVGGNLTVNGSTITLNSTTVTVDDPIFTLGGDTAPTTDDNKDRGIEFRYYNGSAKVGFFGYDDSTGYFTFIPDAINTSEVFSGTTGTLDVAGITGNAATATSAAKWTTARTVTFATGDVTGSFTIDGSADVSNVALTIAANSVALGTDTTGNYVATVAAGTPGVETSSSGLTISAAAGEGTAATIAHADTSTLTGSQGTAGIAAITVDGFGHVTAVTTATYLTSESTDFKTVTVSDTDSGYTWATTGSAVAETTGDTLTIVDGNGIDIDVDAASDAIRIQHSDTSSATNLSATSRTYVDSLTFDTFGHVTGYTTSSESVVDTNVLYDISAITTSGGASIRLHGTDSTNDDLKFASGTNVTVAYTDANTITISSTDTDTNTTYDISSVTTTGGALLRLTAGGSGSGTDDVKFANGGAITVSYTDANTITIDHTDTSSVSNLTATSRTYVTALTFDTYGHITAYSTASETVTDTNTTYDISAVTTSGGALLRLTAGGSGSGTDDVKFAGAGITSIAYTDASTITITSTEADTLDSVTTRGSSTTNSITVGDIAVNGGDITTDQATFNIANTNATTVGAFNAATTLNLGYTDTAASTTNISTGAIISGQTKTVNIGTGGVSGSTSTINIGIANGGTTTVNNNLTVGGNLTVNGTTTTVNSTTVTIDDPIFTIGGDTPPTTDDNKDRGIEFRWHTGSAAKVGFFGYDESTGYFTFIPDATNTSEVFSGTTGTLDVASITGSAAKWTTSRTVTFSGGDVTGSFSIDGSADVSGVALTIAADSIALGTDTTGNYVATVAAGTPGVETSSSGLTISAAAGEGTAATIAHADTSALTGAQGTAGIAAITVDGFGHVTAVTTATYLTTQSTDFKTVTVTDTDSGYTWSTTGSAVGSSTGDTITIVDGGGIDIDADSASKAIRIQHTDTSSVSNLSATSRTYVSALTFDTYGHVTAYSTASETVTDTNTTYDVSSVTTTGGALLRLTAGGSGSGTDDVKFASGTNVTVAYTDANTITISSTDTDTNTTYSQSAVTTTGGALLRLTAGGSGSGNDDVKFASGNAITVSYTDADTITIDHNDTSTAANLTATSRTYVTALTFDTYGHVTAYSTASETVTDTNTTYDISAVTTTGGALLRLTAGGSGSGTDDVKFAGAGITSIAYTDASTITITSTEADTLDSVTGRGSSTANSITVGDIAVNGGDITTDQATFGLVDTNATTVNAFGATTTLNLGYDGTAASTTNISIGATATSTTKTINLGTGGAAGSTTTINIGSASGGTTTVNNNLTVSGNLTVNGTTTTVNSTTVTIDDPIFTLGGDTAPSTDDNKDRGIEFRWHTGSAAKVGFFGYDDSSGRFTFIPDATNTSEVFSGSAGDVAFGGVYASTVTGGNVQLGVTSTTTIDTSSGNLTINSAGGTTTIDDAATVTGTLDVTGVINANSTAAATNTTSGALIVDGGVGIAQKLYVGDTINTAKGVQFTPIALASAPAYTEGLLWYNSDAKTLQLYSASSDFSIFMGEREWVRGRNTYGSTIYKGQPVYATGVHIPGNPIHGHHPTLAPADASDVDKIQVLGLAAHDIPDGQHGYVIVRGYLDNLDTSMLMTGMRFHLGFATPGELVMTAPEYPNFPVDLGICLTQDATTGTVYVQIANHTQERLRVTGTARIDGDLTVGGNLNLLGGGSTLTLANLSVDNNFIYLNSGDTIGEANTNFTGSGLNDAAFVGHYEGTTTKHFYVKIDSVGGGTGGKDTFAWSLDNFATTIASGIDLSTTAIALQSNISVVFQATVGHTLNDKWDGTAAPVNLDIAIIGNRNTGSTGVGYTHIGLFFDVSDEKWKLFKEYDPEPTVNIDTSDASFALGNLVANAFEGALIGNATTSSYWANSRTVTFATGDVTGSFTIDGSTNVSDVALTIAANSVALGTDTTGNYVATVASGTPGAETSSSGLTISAAAGEGTAATIAHADTSTLTGAQGTAGIAAITVDGFGHVTAVTTATYLTAESDTLDSVAARGASTSRALTTTNATSSTNTTSGALIVTGGVGIGENLNVGGSIKVDSAYNLSSATATTTSTTPTAIATFSKTTFGGGKVVIQAYNTITGHRTISEMLIVHDGTTANATEYGIVNTSTAIATYDVDINSGDIRIIATAATSQSTQYKVVQTLILA